MGIKGFLLLEVLVAVVVLSLGIVFVLNGFSSCLNAAGTSRDFIIASNLIEQKIFEYDVKPPDEIADKSGDFGREYKGYSWELDTEELDELELAEAAFKVIWQTGRRKSSFDVVTYYEK